GANGNGLPTALVTGASSGIGRELAKVLAGRGHHVVLVARREPALRELARELRLIPDVRAEVLPADLADPAAPQAIYDALGERGIAVDVLVNNAGFAMNGPFADGDLPTHLRMLQVNVVALTHLTRLFLPAMVARGSGRVLNVASIAAYVPGPLMAAYFASKSFVLSF